MAVESSPDQSVLSRLRGRQVTRPTQLLIAVCVVHALAPIVLMGLRLGLGFDETVYLSQISSHLPPGNFSAPRARGVPLLVAPMTSWTSSVGAIRMYLSVLSGLALYAAFRPWQRVRPGYLAPIAAALFSTLWVSVYYSYQAMPNEWDAYAAVAAAGYLVLACRQPAMRRDLVCLTLAVTVVTLLRPADGLYLAAGLILAVLCARLSVRQSATVIVPIVVALILGWGEWIIESYAYFNGPIQRLHAATGENGGGINFALPAQARALAGPILCRKGCQAHAALIDRVWWIAIPVLVGAAIIGARQRRDAAVILLVPTIAGLAVVAEYTVTVNYAAPRFLLPAYGLLAIPCAAGVMWLCRARPRFPSARPWLVAGTLVLLIAHVVVQTAILRRDVLPASRAGKKQYLADARELREHGVRRPCIILGPTDGQLSYTLGCQNFPSRASELQARFRDGVSIAAVLPGHSQPPSQEPWQQVRVTGRNGRHWTAYLLIAQRP